MNTTFEINLFDDEHDPYVAREIRPVNDDGVWRESPLTGGSTSLYGAIAKLCFMRLEMEEKTDEIFAILKYYYKLYPKAAQQSVADNSS